MEKEKPADLPLFAHAEAAPGVQLAPIPEPAPVTEGLAHPLPSHAMLDNWGKRWDRFKLLKGDKRTLEVLELVKELSDLRPPEIIENYDSDLRQTVEQLEADQLKLADAGSAAKEAAKPGFQGRAHALVKTLKELSKKAGHLANTNSPAYADETPIEDEHLSHYARDFQQRLLMKQLNDRLQPLYKAADYSDVSEDTIGAIQRYYNAGGDMMRRDAVADDKINLLRQAPTKENLIAVTATLERKITDFDKKHKDELPRWYNNSGGMVRALQEEEAPTMPDFLYLARWSRAADIMSQRVEKYAISLRDPDPVINRTKQETPKISDAIAQARAENNVSRPGR